MPNIEPPAAGLLRPAHRTVLTTGTRVWRVHSSHRAPHAPNPTPQPDELAAGRFDSLGPQLRLPLPRRQPRRAIAETICRDLPLDPSIARIVPASAVTGRTLTALTVTRTLTAAALHGPHLAAVGQDLWLTKCEARHFRHHPPLGPRHPGRRPRHRRTRLPAEAQRRHPRLDPHHRPHDHTPPRPDHRPHHHLPATRPRPRPRPRRPHHRRPQRHPLPHLNLTSVNAVRHTTPTVMYRPGRHSAHDPCANAN